MLALRLTRGAHPAVHLRRLLVATAAAGTGFLLLSALGYAMSHPDDLTDPVLRLAWCAVPLAATVYFAVAVARTDPGTRPRPGLSAFGLGPARLMAISVLTTALSCTLGSMVALLLFLHLRGDLRGMPFDGAAAEFLAAGDPLPLPAALTLLALVPATASATVAVALRPRRATADGTRRAAGRLGSSGRGGARETSGAAGLFGARPRAKAAEADAHAHATGRGTIPPVPDQETGPEAPDQETVAWTGALAQAGDDAPAPQDPPSGLPWGVAVLAAGLAVEAYASRSATGTTVLPGGTAAGTTGVLAGWVLTAVGLILAGPGLTHLCGRLLQAVRPGALRLLAGRGLMAEATRIGRPLGVVCAVVSGVYAMTALYGVAAPSIGPLATLGTLQVTGCAVATLCTAAVEARQSRAGTTSALLRLGAPASTLRSAAALRAGALLALFGPLSLVIADLAALPLAS